MSGVDYHMNMNIDALRVEWLARELKKLEEKRRYPHFDPIIGVDDEQKRLLFDPDAVKRHSFLPLIKSIKEERRRKFDEQTGERALSLKERPICYAAHIDSLIYSWYAYQINDLYGQMLGRLGISGSVLAYRALDKSTPDHVREVGEFIMKKGDCVALCYDVSDFFGTVPRDAIRENLLRALSLPATKAGGRLPDDHFRVLRAVTGSRTVEIETLRKMFPKGKIPVSNGRYLPKSSFLEFVLAKHRALKKTDGKDLLMESDPVRGIPQGLPISGVLANLAMLDFDIEMAALAAAHGGMYRRYSDDILLVVDLGATATIEDAVQTSLDRLGLTPNDKKREVRTFRRVAVDALSCENEDGKNSRLQYLGLEFDGRWFFIRSQSVSRFHRNLKRTIGRASAKLRGRGGKVLRHRDLYRRFTSLGAKEGSRNFLTYAKQAHRILSPHSRINRQLSDGRIQQIIKRSVRKRMTA